MGVKGALWVNDTMAIQTPPLEVEGYAFAEVVDTAPVVDLARFTGLGLAGTSERLERGVRAYAAWARPAGEMAAVLWVSAVREWSEPSRGYFEFADDECYGWEAQVAPEHQGHRLFTRLLLMAGHRAAQAGYRWIWGAIEDSNLASRYSNMAAGYQPILHLLADTSLSPTRLEAWPVDYADRRLVERAYRVAGAGVTAVAAAV